MITQNSIKHHPIDKWALDFFTKLLSQKLSCEEFEQAIDKHWENADFVLNAPATADYMLAEANRANLPAGYGNDALHIGFTSKWLVGMPGKPGAIHIDAPPEASINSGLDKLNRRPHQHDSGRIALVTRGCAIFHVVRKLADGSPIIVNCPVASGSMIFWPAWTPHTFNACRGFSLISAMANYVSPAEDGFTFPLSSSLPALENLKQLSLTDYLESLPATSAHHT
jgi:hypothetical protein